MTTTATTTDRATTLPVRRAADQVVRAVEAVDDLFRLRFGVLLGVNAMQAAAATDPDACSPDELQQTLDVWLALDALAKAVADQRANAAGAP